MLPSPIILIPAYFLGTGHDNPIFIFIYDSQSFCQSIMYKPVKLTNNEAREEIMLHKIFE
jgi:hypothetical protein